MGVGFSIGYDLNVNWSSYDWKLAVRTQMMVHKRQNVHAKELMIRLTRVTQYKVALNVSDLLDCMNWYSSSGFSI